MIAAQEFGGRAIISVLLLSLALGACQRASERSGPQGVVLIVLDTLRADRVGCYGYERPTTPNIDALAARGTRFDQAIASSPWTLPSFASLLAGQYSERVFDDGLTASVVEDLRQAGIETAAFTEGGYVSRHFRFDRGFDEWTEEEGSTQLTESFEERDPNPTGGAAHTFGQAAEWLRERIDGRFFLLVHSYEPHTPYTNGHFAQGLDAGRVGPEFGMEQLAALRERRLELTSSEAEYVRALYDGDIRFADHHVGVLLEALDELELAGKVAVIVTSDHGEDLDSRFVSNHFDHGHSLRDDLMRIPLIVHDPTRGKTPAVVDAQVRIIDIMPTVAEMFGVPLSARDGLSLLTLTRGEESQERLAVLGQAKVGPRRVGLRSNGHKYIRSIPSSGPRVPMDPQPEDRQLYELASDSEERNNLAGARPEMLELFERILAGSHPAREKSISADMTNVADPELVERLRSLGYLR